MITQKFEIKVGLLGYVSVGKTTVLNATLRDKFSEVSMRRTTAGINYFRIASPAARAPAAEAASNDAGNQWSGHDAEPASQVLREIETSNQALRGAGKIEEKWFNIELEEPLCEMRQDTSLVLVDIPGINEADSDSIYIKYVEEKWKTFDCVVAVMDARQGVNTEEQLALLNLIKKNLSDKKDIPVIILFNKVDEPDNTEQLELVQEAREKISQIFGVGCREDALQRVLEAATSPEADPKDTYPVFIATSAVHAFFYRAASLLSFDQFQTNFKMDLIDMIGREEVGRFRWKKLPPRQKYKAVYKCICEDESYQERLADTNFDSYLTALSLAVGGPRVQKKILEKQVEIELEELLSGQAVQTSDLRAIYEKASVLNKDMASLKDCFWIFYETLLDKTLTALENTGEVTCMVPVIQTLENYCSFIRPLQWKAEETKVCAEARALVRKQVQMVLKKQDLEKCWKMSRQICGACASEGDNSSTIAWDDLSLHDWLVIFDSILLLSYDKTFCEVFGREKVLLSQLQYRFVGSLAAPIECGCSKCQPVYNYRSYDRHGGSKTETMQNYNVAKPTCFKCNRQLPTSPCRKVSFSPLGNWELDFADGSSKRIREQLKVPIPASLSSPNHWGHVAWKCCTLLKDLKGAHGDGTEISED